MLAHEGGRLGVARVSGEPLLGLLFRILSAPVEVCRGYGLALRLLHQPLLVLKVISLYLLGLLEELIVRRIVDNNAALVVLVERVLCLLLALVGCVLSELR